MSREDREGRKPPELYTVKEAAVIFKVSDRTVWRWIENKLIRPTRFRGSRIVRISQSEIDRMLAGK
jgi:excisionase family DNA binding protein